MISNALLKVSLAMSLIVIANSSKAHAEIQKQVHLRTGMVSSSMASSIGSTTGEISVVPSFDAEYETFLSDRSSFVFRGIMAYEMSTTITRYMFAGVGQRYYLNSRGSALVAATPETTVVIRPKFRYYYGWDAGLSQVVVNVLTASLQSFTTAIDVGGGGGFLYQMTDNLGIGGNLTISYAFGFSSVAAAGMVMKGFGGLTYSF